MKLNATRGGQYQLSAEFVFNFDDTVVDINGATKDFKTAGTIVFDAINLPVGAIVLGGSVTAETAVGGATGFTVAVGDSANAARYLTATAALVAGTTPLVPTGYVGNGENIRLTVVVTGTGTAGKHSVKVQYVVRNRMNEVQTH